ncbi:ABC transporter permease [Olivibacter domesticus]|uniref:Putative ABC transport system permease protein n=1 Tax=Olivibacter domesticus TaxID=407022 RepID=A0A1H7SGM1_OLID1|nr:ABC transporter permease [Olivibacter domesticus]SEL71655.1 putative ABC transport system permease protein [Olivibacter domesticus]
MFKNYIKIAWRNLMKNKVYSFINISGLTIGLTCCFIICVYLVNELSYDKYNKQAEHVYRVERTFLNQEDKSVSLDLGAVAPPFAPLLKNDFKEIKTITTILPIGDGTIQYNDKIFKENELYFADEHLFDVFDVNLKEGNIKNALTEPYSILLTEEVAKRYFGNENPINKMIKINQQLLFKVTGIYESLPANSHWHPDVLLSFSSLKDTAIYGEEQLRTNWGNNMFYLYLLLPKGFDAKQLEAQFPAFLNRHVPDGSNKASNWTSLSLRKLSDIHLYSHKDSELEENGDIKRVYIFSIIGIFILLIACINYMNLSTARSALRAREIGVRKVVGANKSELIAQFLSESILICWVAAFISFLLTWLLLPLLNNLSGQTLSMSLLLKAQILIPLLLLPFFIGIVSGIYPAIFLSSFRPVKVLKGLFKNSEKAFSLRKILVVIQFSISIILIVSTAIVFQQLSFIQNKSLGFNKEQVIILNNNDGLDQSFQSFRNSLTTNTAIQDVARSSRIPSGRLLDAQGAQINLGNSLAPSKADIKYLRVDEGFIPTYGISMLSGRNFKGQDGSDTSSFVLNQAAVRALGIQSNEEALGKQFKYGDQMGQIAGVMNDFNFESLHQRILPLVLSVSTGENDYNRISIRVSGDVQRAVQHIEATWKKYLPEVPFDYTFLDSRFADLYKAEHQQQVIFSVFAGVAIFIACLGLFGLSAFTITQRVKEIGIRKVLGASIGSIVRLLSKDFLLLVALAALVAFPIAWFAMSSWLSDFAYRIDISWEVFVVATCVALLIAFITISVQTVKAALANPVKSLRSE